MKEAIVDRIARTVLPISFLLLLCLLCIHVSYDWTFSQDDNGAWFTHVARSHLLNGISATWGQDCFTPIHSEELVPYLHHPPFVGLYLAGVFRAVGSDAPVFARGAFIVLHLLSFVLFSMLARRILRDRVAIAIAVLTFAIVPMSSFFGRMPNHEVPGLLFWLSGILAVWNARLAQTRMWFAIAILSGVATAVSSWHATICFLAFLVFAPACLFPSGRKFRLSLLFAVIASATAVLFHILVCARHFAVTPWRGSLGGYMLAGGASGLSSMGRVLMLSFKNGLLLFGGVPWIVLLVMFIPSARQRIVDWRIRGSLPWALSAGTVFYCLLFPRAISFHGYQLFYLLPLVSLCFGSACGRLSHSPRRSSRLILASVLAALLLSSFGRDWRLLTGHGSGYAREVVKQLDDLYK